MRESLMPKCPCPSCGKVLDAATHCGDAAPSPGDVSICMGCGELAEYGPDLRLQPLSQESLAQIDLTEIQAVRRIWARWQQHKATPSATPP